LAKKSGPKPRIDRSSPEFQQRVAGFKQARKKGDRDRARKNFAERMLGAYGFGEENFNKGGFIKGKLGLFAEAMNTDQKQEQADSPTMEEPKTERERQNPSISTIVDQLNSIIKVANRVGVISSEQQQSLQRQIAVAERNAREASMEAGTKIDGVGTNFTPLNDDIGTLIEKLKPLKKVVDEKVKEQEEEKNANRGFMQRLSESYGVGDEYEKYARGKAAKAARIRTKPGFRSVVGANGRVTYRGPNGRFASAADAVAQAKPSMLSRVSNVAKGAGTGLINVAKRAANVGGVAAKVGGTRLASGALNVSKRVASTLGKGFKAVGASGKVAGTAVSSVLKRLAGPVITKALGGLAAKSIPFIGAAIGLGQGALRLVQGDVVGAGIDAVSGLGSLATALPAMVLSIVRDLYSSVFGVQPERDPNVVPRMKFATGVITGLVAAMLASKLARASTKDASSTIPKAATQQSGQAPTGGKIPPAVKGGSGGSLATTKPKDLTTYKPTTAKAPVATKKPSAAGSSAPTSKPTQTPTPSGSSTDAAMEGKKPDQTMVNAPPTTGAEITEKTAEVQAAANQPSSLNLSPPSVPLPATKPTTRSGVSGAGNVPDPNYYGMGIAFQQMYFNPDSALGGMRV